jgi:hypothetical protein
LFSCFRVVVVVHNDGGDDTGGHGLRRRHVVRPPFPLSSSSGTN